MTPSLVILDRDNTLVRVPTGVRYLYGEDPIVLLPGVGPALRHLARRGIRCVVATNQQGVSMKKFPKMTIDSVAVFNHRLDLRVEQEGGRIDRFYVCPHLDDEDCNCRKPRPGLFIMALRDYNIAPTQAVGIGNSQSDVDAATAAGIQSISVPYPPGTQPPEDHPAYRTLLHAVRAICGGSGNCGRIQPAES